MDDNVYKNMPIIDHKGLIAGRGKRKHRKQWLWEKLKQKKMDEAKKKLATEKKIVTQEIEKSVEGKENT